MNTFRFFWDEPLGSILTLIYHFSQLPGLLAPGLSVAIWAHRRIARLDARAADPWLEYSVDGAMAATAILAAGNALDRKIVVTNGPLANFYDPSRRELRLSKAVAEGRTPEALGIAAHEAGHALQDAQGYLLGGIRPALVLAARLGSGVACMSILAGFLWITPTLCYQGAMLYNAIVLALLALQIIERDANRRSRIAQPLAGLGESRAPADRPFLEALETARWAEIAALCPDPRVWWSKSPTLFR